MVTARVRAFPRSTAATLLAISLGGGLGALCRAALIGFLPAASQSFPWGTLLVNVLGCGLMGSLVVLVDRVWPRRRLIRPFLGVGMLGGFTSFSTYAVDVYELLARDALGTAFGYLMGTVLSALGAVALGGWLTRAVLARGTIGSITDHSAPEHGEPDRSDPDRSGPGHSGPGYSGPGRQGQCT